MAKPRDCVPSALRSMRAPGGRARQGERGFTLIELSIAMIASTVVMLVLYGSVTMSVRSRATVQRKHHVSKLAADYLNRLREIPFGTPADPTATNAELTELLDDDYDLGTGSLYGMLVGPTAAGYSFQIRTHGDLTTWRIKVTQDLDGNGVVSGGREGRSDILRIDIFAQNRRVMYSIRAAEPSLTIKDP